MFLIIAHIYTWLVRLMLTISMLPAVLSNQYMAKKEFGPTIFC